MVLPGSYQIEIDIELTGGNSPDPPDGSYGCTTMAPALNNSFFFVATTNYVGGYSNSAVYTKELKNRHQYLHICQLLEVTIMPALCWH